MHPRSRQGQPRGLGRLGRLGGQHRRAVIAAAAAIAGLVALAGCGQQAATASGKLGIAPSSPAPDQQRIDLVVTTRADPAAAPVTWTVTCQPTGGTHPNKDAACTALLAAGDNPLAPVVPGKVCTQQVGSTQTATVIGLWYGSRVSAKFNQRNGCEIARWEAIGPLFSDGAENDDGAAPSGAKPAAAAGGGESIAMVPASP